MESKPAFDPAQFKAATREQWDRTGKGWNEQTPWIRAWLADSTAAMLEAAEIGPGMRVLDVAAGAGDQTLDIARRVGPTGSVLATDLSSGILAFARENAERAGLTNVETLAVDGEDLGVEESSFDAAICRLGLMFFPDALRGLREMHRGVKPDGRACTLVMSEPRTNPCVVTVMVTALQHAGLPPRDPYQPGGLLSLGEPGFIEQLFEQARFKEVHTMRLSAPFRLPSVQHYMEFLRTSTGPILQILGRLDDAAKAAAWADIETKLSVFTTPNGWEGPNELLLTVGRK